MKPVGEADEVLLVMGQGRPGHGGGDPDGDGGEEDGEPEGEQEFHENPFELGLVPNPEDVVGGVDTLERPIRDCFRTSPAPSFSQCHFN